MPIIDPISILASESIPFLHSPSIIILYEYMLGSMPISTISLRTL
uniref:Uncharacterized protein n=1 Tax=Rhizophora mucronata TaxID=61149 RepID=A0A2P2NNL3_RHIMU